MKRIIATFIATLVALAAFSAPVFAAQCDTTVKVFKFLMNGKYKEKGFAYGTSNRGKIKVDLLVDPETGSWTLVTSDPKSKMSCVQSSGENFSIGDATPKKKPVIKGEAS